MFETSQTLENATLDMVFITPILKYIWPDSEQLNGRLQSIFVEEEKEDIDTKDIYSNIGGWHSKTDLQSRDEGSIQTIMSRFNAMVMEITRRTVGLPYDTWNIGYDISAWANINRSGNYNIPHIHNSHWAGVYYVSTGKSMTTSRRDGIIEFLDPRPAAMMMNIPGKFFSQRCFVHPVPGLMILFPGWLTHFVNPFLGEGARISVACNITITKLDYV
jgi:uncharacterized protein (TIGR02466 family)